MPSTPAPIQAAFDRQRRLDFDPYHLMPASLPAHPRVHWNAADVARVREWVKDGSLWPARAMKRVEEETRKPLEVPAALPNPSDNKLNFAILNRAERHALLAVIRRDPAHADAALKLFRLLCEGYLKLPYTRGDARAAGGGLNEGKFCIRLARVYDNLETSGINDADRALFRATLNEAFGHVERCGHHTCGNHNTWNLVASLALAVALGDMQRIHDALYIGPASDKNDIDVPPCRYGLVHTLRHDVLDDGYHWERTGGYHMYTLMGLTEAAWIASHAGIPLFHQSLPAAGESEGYDIHRDYRPDGAKCLKAMYDAPLYWAHPSGDIPLLHDSGLAHLRGIPIWGPLFQIAYDAYRDPRYAWMIHATDKLNASRPHADLPVGLHYDYTDVDFVRLRHLEYPAGAFSLANDTPISLEGRHTRGCTLFPTSGHVLLRSDAHDPRAANAYLFVGGHVAGHQSPAPLHLDLHGLGAPFATPPRPGGYDDPLYLPWVRTTIAHNTVSVDQASAFPYDFDTRSIWEADAWRQHVSGAAVLNFQPEAGWSAVRAVDQSVYKGVTLDRTVVLTRDYAIDLFRVFCDQTRQYDWAMHLLAQPLWPGKTTPASLGDARGYDKLTNARTLERSDKRLDLAWQTTNGAVLSQFALPDHAAVVLADDPAFEHEQLGDLAIAPRATSLLLRVKAGRAMFISLWRFTGDATLEETAGDEGHTVEVRVKTSQGRTHWWLPSQRRSIQMTRS